VARARKIQRFLSQPFDVAKVFTGSDGVQVPLEDTIQSFKAVVAGEYDHLPEAAFYMVGGIDEVIAKAEKLWPRKPPDRAAVLKNGGRGPTPPDGRRPSWQCNSIWSAPSGASPRWR
jgi:hypothetical protein